jgi:ankyrin repeat protein
VRVALPNGFTSLHFASENGRESVVRLLLDRGADVGERDGEGKTALLLAGQQGHEDVVQLLVEAARR